MRYRIIASVLVVVCVVLAFAVVDAQRSPGSVPRPALVEEPFF